MSTSTIRQRATTASAPRTVSARLDEHTEFRQLVDITGATLHGRWHLVRGVGELGYGSPIFARDETSGTVVPLGAVRQLLP